MKHTIHTPTEQYGFVETEFEENGAETLQLHRAIVEAVKGGTDAVGMDTKEFNGVLDELLTTNAITGDPGMMEKMNVEQQTIIQAVKRSRARTKEKVMKVPAVISREEVANFKDKGDEDWDMGARD